MKEHYQCFLWMRNLLLHPMLTTVAFNWWGTVHVARSWTSGFPFTWSFPSVQIGNYLVLFPPHCRLLPVVLKAGKLWTSVEDGTDLGWSALVWLGFLKQSLGKSSFQAFLRRCLIRPIAALYLLPMRAQLSDLWKRAPTCAAQNRVLAVSV